MKNKSIYYLTKRDISILEKRNKCIQNDNETCSNEFIFDTYQAANARLLEAQNILKEKDCKITHLELRQNQMNDHKTELLSAAIESNSSINKIIISRCRLRSNQLKLICESICRQNGKPLQNLQLKELSITKKGGEAIARVLSECINLTKLTLYQTNLDTETLIEICNGLKQSKSLQFLDLRKNQINSEGLSALITALSEHKSLKQLCFEGLRLQQKDAKLLAQFLKQEECKIEQLELKEANLDKNSLDLILDSLYKEKILQKLSLDKNYFTDSIYESLSQTTIQLTQLKNLSLSRCDLSSEALKILCSSFKSEHTRVQNLDLSWNNISGEDIIFLKEMLEQNNSIEKLLIQHNFLGEEGVKHLVDAIPFHQNLKYLDISANEISSEGFKLFADVLSNNPILHSLHVRKNQIEDIKVLESISNALKQNSNLFYLDLKDNEIEDEGALKLLELTQENHYIEDIVIGGNPKVSLITQQKIADECRKNIQIKDFILLNLMKKESKAQGGDGLPKLNRRISTLNVLIKDQYSIGELNLTNAKYNKSDFIVKFIQLTKDDLEVLDFCKITFSNHMNDLTEYLSKGNSNISSLTLEECDIGDTPLTQLILECRVMTSLRELRLVRLPRLATHTKEILQSLQNHKYLNILDLRDNNIQSMSEIARLLANNQFLNEINLKGNNISTLNDFRELLSGLSQNLSVTKLTYDIEPSLITMVKVSRYKENIKNKDEEFDKNNKKQIEYLDPQEHRLLEDQLGMNEYIQRVIIPTQEIYKVKGTNTVDMSGKDVGNAIDAVVKYFSVQNVDEGRGFTKKTRLVLNHCKLKEKHINSLVGGLLKIQKFEIEQLDLSHNEINDKACKYLAGILQSNKKLKQLLLGKNQNITAEGFKELSMSLKKNTQLEILDLSACFIELKDETDWQEIQQDLSSNCRLVQIDLIGNDCDLVFMKELQNQLAQNKQIQEFIVAQIVKKNEEMRQIRRETRRRQKSMSKDFENQSDAVNIIKLNGDQSQQPNAPKNQNAGQKSNMQTCVSIFPFGKEIAAFFGDSSDEDETNQRNDAEENHGGFKKTIQRRTSSMYKRKNPKHKMDGGMDSQFPKSLNFEPIVGIKDDEKKAQSDNENTEDENPFEAAKAFDFSQVQKLSLRGKNLQSLDFLTKFMRENPNIVDIDLGDNPLSANEIDKFSKNLKLNKSVRNLGLDGIKNLNQNTKTIINAEIKKNELIQDIISKNMSSQNGSKRQMLKLQGQAIKDVGFIHKFLQGYKNLKVLDLTDNRLGNKGAEEIRALIQDSKTIESLILQNNKIGPQGLQHICSALSVNKSIKYVDIRDNIIQDESLKPLLAVLYANETITNIRYSVTSEENIERLKKFKEISSWAPHKIEEHFSEHDEHHHHLHWWQKICLPLWCWRSFIHDKHEAFRFKYDTKALRIIEEELMDQMTYALYINNIIYYVIMFVCPQIFVAPCAQGFNNISHVIYGIFSVFSIFLEVYFVLKIQKRLNNKRILKFNKWHFVELLFGSIARFDTYLDMCFFNLLHSCNEYKLSLPVIFLIALNITYPLYTLIKLMQTNTSYNHTLPRIERNCRLAFIRENMLLATVLDSFCIDNNVEVCMRPTHQGRIMSVWTLLTQDGPQYAIHLVFLFLVHTDIPHSEFTVLCSLVVSTFAVQISTFNIIMCEPNEFDPILLQIELKKRQDEENKRENILKTQREEWKKGMADQIGNKTLNTLNEIGAQMNQNFKVVSQSHEKQLQLVGSGLKKNQEHKNYLELGQETTRNQDESANYMTNISRI